MGRRERDSEGRPWCLYPEGVLPQPSLRQSLEASRGLQHRISELGELLEFILLPTEKCISSCLKYLLFVKLKTNSAYGEFESF